MELGPCSINVTCKSQLKSKRAGPRTSFYITQRLQVYMFSNFVCLFLSWANSPACPSWFFFETANVLLILDIFQDSQWTMCFAVWVLPSADRHPPLQNMRMFVDQALLSHHLAMVSSYVFSKVRQAECLATFFFLSRLKRVGKDVFLCEITMQQNIVFLQVGNYVYLEANFRTVNSYSSIHHYSAVLKFLELSTACTEFKCWLFCFE